MLSTIDPPFAAVLLAGGQSRRMGRDKALLPLPDGRRLWERQLGVLRALEPAELFISGPARGGFPADVPLLADETPGLGPLAGIAAALKAMRSPRAVVLAVDLPAMATGFLRGLLDGHEREPARPGVIPQTAGGFFEPLAAIYPRAAAGLAEERLRGDDRSLQAFARALIAGKLAVAHPVQTSDAGLFVNWNQPQDLPPADRGG